MLLLLLLLLLLLVGVVVAGGGRGLERVVVFGFCVTDGGDAWAAIVEIDFDFVATKFKQTNKKKAMSFQSLRNLRFEESVCLHYIGISMQ